MVDTLAVMMMLPVVGVIVRRFWVTGPQRKPSNGVVVIDTVDRAETYLRRIVALTGATRVGPFYLLDVGKTRFEVHDSYVCRTQHFGPPCIAERLGDSQRGVILRASTSKILCFRASTRVA